MYCLNSNVAANGTCSRTLSVAIAAIVGFFGGCQRSAHTRRPPPSIVAFGDSITRGYGVPVGTGWVELLSARLQGTPEKPGVSVFNAGGNGNTSAEGMSRIEADVLPHLPGLVLVEFGGNDATHDARHVTVDDFERNLLTICQRVWGRGGDIVLVTFPPIINAWHLSHSDAYYDRWGGLDQRIEQYRSARASWPGAPDIPSST
jgi:lysophospholipase L1-like esterase